MTENKTNHKREGNENMNENNKSLIDTLAEMLATMTARAIRSERNKEEALKCENEWYKRWEAKNAEAEKLNAELAAAKEELEQTRRILFGRVEVEK